MKSTDLLFDIETDGFLENVTKIHSIVIGHPEADNNRIYSCCDYATYAPQDPNITVLTIDDGLRMLQEADSIIGHNILAYDLPVIRKLRPWFNLDDSRAIDTLIMAKLRWSRDKLRALDFRNGLRLKMPQKLYGNHGLEAFGFRMGVMKGEYKDACKEMGIPSDDIWKSWRPEMQDYCVQDIAVTKALYAKIQKEPYAPTADAVEHAVQSIAVRMMGAGFPFDEKGAQTLYSTVVQERDTLGASLIGLFPAWYVADTTTTVVDGAKVRTPAKTEVLSTRLMGSTKTDVKEINPATGRMRKVTKVTGGVLYPEGAVYTKIKLTEFNPNSRDHIANRLNKVYGWEPTEYTDKGQAKVDETVLAGLLGIYPECVQLSRYMLLQKRAGQISEGDEGWLKVSRKGIVYGSYNTIGAVTRRMTHSRPNIAQVPKVGSYFGQECRSLFWAGYQDSGEEWKLVGADLSGIELRCLAHYMAPWDGGAYAKAVVEGKQEDGTDVHSINCRALGLDPKAVYVVRGKATKGRDLAKTYI